MKATIHDHISKHDVSISLIGNAASMTANGKVIETTIRAGDLSLAKIAVSKRDLESFGSFFETPVKIARAA